MIHVQFNLTYPIQHKCVQTLNVAHHYSPLFSLVLNDLTSLHLFSGGRSELSALMEELTNLVDLHGVKALMPMYI